MKTVLFTLSVLFVSANIAFAGGKPGWDDDYAKARAAAGKDKKLVLLDFTGSDWCSWCMKLDKEVFSKSDFKSFAKDNLELVEVDFPHSKRVPKKTQEQNKELETKFDVHGFPTIVLVDAEGKEQARWVGFKANLLEELKAKVPAPAKKE